MRTWANMPRACAAKDGNTSDNSTKQPLQVPKLPLISPISAETKTQSARAPTILVVDDEEDYRIIFSELFKDVYQVLTAENGAEGLNRLEKMKNESNPPVIVIADLKMPMMNGDEMIRKARKMSLESKFILCTVNRGEDTEELVSKLKRDKDLDLFVYKPVNIAEFRKEIEKLLKKDELGKEYGTESGGDNG